MVIDPSIAFIQRRPKVTLTGVANYKHRGLLVALLVLVSSDVGPHRRETNDVC